MFEMLWILSDVNKEFDFAHCAKNTEEKIIHLQHFSEKLKYLTQLTETEIKRIAQ